MARDTWDPGHLPDLSGRRYLVTGSNAGLGFFSCLQLAGAGAHVIMSGRNPSRLSRARAALLAQVPDADLETLALDTSNLGSIRSAAATVRGRVGLHGVLLNAGIVHPPRTRELTLDGHELVIATNALGHYALAGALLPALAAARGRMVWLGSVSTTLFPWDPVDPELVHGYTPWRAYVQSKVATSALGFEADRRLRAASVPVASLVAHPGYSLGGRTRRIAGVNAPTRRKRFVGGLQAPIAQSKERGAWAPVRALVDADAEGGEYWGPAYGITGAPERGTPSRVTIDPDVGARMWHYAEHATRTEWPYLRGRKIRIR
ncbi:SDR family NAD(P)-dependent oxidoreductase [Microbacterium sp. 179-B 1A2 NHS]|uniref:SDR family NAD(P)-dependent oxidoreductase n=1 Tax=Microbacterium sp. 179-B 1A2 NHS TaxID=3142383 RepID=UPI00399F52F7